MKDSQYTELWEFPGGKLEVGETHKQAAVRELEEELNVKVSINQLQGLTFQSYPWWNRHLVRCLFTVDGFSGIVKSKENQSFKWVSLDELRKFEFMTGDAVFADWVIAHYKDNV
ncbi:MAG: NUDIX domain-containing protein [Akkermansiaceae bacterium]|nr:NUDIX domain-containing protein [Akkermansiaceae bacterium]